MNIQYVMRRQGVILVGREKTLNKQGIVRLFPKFPQLSTNLPCQFKQILLHPRTSHTSRLKFLIFAHYMYVCMEKCRECRRPRMAKLKFLKFAIQNVVHLSHNGDIAYQSSLMPFTGVLVISVPKYPRQPSYTHRKKAINCGQGNCLFAPRFSGCANPKLKL